MIAQRVSLAHRLFFSLNTHLRTPVSSVYINPLKSNAFLKRKEKIYTEKINMEDSVIESERLAQLNVNLSKPTDDEAKQEDQERDVGNGNHESGGLLNQLFSNLTSPKGRDVVYGEQADGDQFEEEEEKREVELDSGGGGGVLNNLISNLFIHNEGESEAKERKEEGKVDEGSEVQVKVAEGEDQKVESGGGGIINNLISNLLHPSEVEVKEAEEKKEEGKVNEGTEEDLKEESGGGIINNIISSMPDELVPDTDEASILIHSIIHD